MKALEHYRIIDDMGTFYPQQEYIGFRGRKKWKTIQCQHCVFGESWYEDVTFQIRKDAEKWLAAEIAEKRLNAELKKRGPIVVREIK